MYNATLSTIIIVLSSYDRWFDSMACWHTRWEGVFPFSPEINIGCFREGEWGWTKEPSSSLRRLRFDDKMFWSHQHPSSKLLFFFHVSIPPPMIMYVRRSYPKIYICLCVFVWCVLVGCACSLASPVHMGGISPRMHAGMDHGTLFCSQ